ncbi:MAG: Na(+)-translocating NADH-quinone reductase subunit C [Planctomycetia bacterium]|nr:Na(+)-translocating NADH-quinone reductase subunit C [Planctomycetia bacterium]
MKDSIFKTFAVAFGLCIVCSVIVSVAAVSLKPKQDENKQLDKQINILRAAGLVDAKESPNAAQVKDLFSQIESVVVNIETGDAVADVDTQNVDPKNVTKLPKDQDPAGIGSRPNEAVVYLVKENGVIQTIVLPVFGRGLWSTMYGFIALKGDFKTVANLTFYDQLETAGLGGEIANPKWTQKWIDKTAVDDSGKPVIKVIKGNVDPASPNANEQVDGISGATLTGNGVTKTVEYWLGENGFGPYLNKLRSGN